MNELKTIDFSTDLHHSISSNPKNIFITMQDGNNLVISWDLAKAIKEMVGEK